MTWRHAAACRDTDPDLWFLDSHENAVMAKRVCRACPVRDECRETHLGETVGIFGGLSPVERQQERRRRRNMGEAA